MRPLYSLRNISKTYVAREGPVLQISSLDIPRGQVIALIGYSGSGKTTLLSLLGLLESPDDPDPSGESPQALLNFHAGPLSELEDFLTLSDARRQELRSTFGFVFQQGYLLEHLTCSENIKIPAYIRGLEPSDSGILDMMQTLGLDEAMSRRPPSDLSGGERQRVSVLRALSHDPSIVLADEPTSNLDDANAAAVLNGLSSWCGAEPEKRSVLLVTHNLEHAAKYAGSAILMASGRVSAPIPIKGQTKHPLTAADLSAQLAQFALTAQSQPQSPPSTLSPRVPPKAALNPQANIRKFVWSFALADVFPPTSADSTESLIQGIRGRGLFQALFRRRNAQFHSMASMFFAMVLAVFFASLYSALNQNIGTVVTDKRVSKIEVLGRRDGERLLSRDDITELSGLSWVDEPGWKGIATPAEIEKNKLRAGRRAVDAAVGYRVRELRFAKNPSESDTGFNTEVTLAAVSTRESDPVLRKIEVFEGSQLATMSFAKDRSVSSVFSSSPGNKFGIVCTKVALEQLGFRGTPPKTISVYPPHSSNGTMAIPVVAIAEWLPKSADILITDDLFARFFFDGGRGDPLPRFESVDVYFEDMMTDGIALYETLQRAGYSIGAERLAFLRWGLGLVQAVRYFSIAAATGLFLVVFITLVVSYSEAIRRKEKQIAVLLAYGTPMALLYAVFLAEVCLVWSIAALLAIPSHWLIVSSVANLVAQGFKLQGSQATDTSLPWGLWLAILAASLTIALGSVLWTMHRRIEPKRLAETLRAPD